MCYVDKTMVCPSNSEVSGEWNALYTELASA